MGRSRWHLHDQGVWWVAWVVGREVVREGVFWVWWCGVLSTPAHPSVHYNPHVLLPTTALCGTTA